MRLIFVYENGKITNGRISLNNSIGYSATFIYKNYSHVFKNRAPGNLYENNCVFCRAKEDKLYPTLISYRVNFHRAANDFASCGHEALLYPFMYWSLSLYGQLTFVLRLWLHFRSFRLCPDIHTFMLGFLFQL